MMEDNKKKLSTEETENNIDKAKLEALMLDSEEDVSNNENPEENVNFEAFMAEYRSLMSKTMAEASEAEEDTDEHEEDFLISPPPKKQKQQDEEKSTANNDSDWDEEITLAPEEYEDLDDGKEMHEELPEEPAPDFNLGEATEESDNKFQLSINFEGEQKPVMEEVIEKETEYDPDKPRAIDWVFDIAEMFVFVLAAVLILTSFLFKHSIVEGDSMLNTLEDGDHLVISDLFYTPNYGDIIVFEDYSITDSNLRKPIVKRVIGLAGDTVKIVRNDQKGIYEVYVNGEYLDEEYVHNAPDDFAPRDGEWTVPEGEVFVLGDNRYNSTDSRDNRVGTVRIDSILGKVLLRFYPFDKFGAID